MFKFRFGFLLMSALFVVIALAACSAPPTSAPAQATAVPVAPTAAPSSGAVVVTDALGRTVKFDKPPQRIVIAGKAFFMIVDAIYLFPDARITHHGGGSRHQNRALTLCRNRGSARRRRARSTPPSADSGSRNTRSGSPRSPCASRKSTYAR